MALEVSDPSESDMEEQSLYDEVEDIMRDQGLISQELNVVAFESKTSNIIFSVERLRIAATLIARTLTPAVLKIYYLYLHNQQLVFNNLRHHLLPTIVAFLANSISRSLATVQKRIIFPPTNRAIKDVEDYSSPSDLTDNSIPEKSVECQILCHPETDHLADVIFIHGLHGGVDRTWKQGQWRHDGHKLKHQFPVRSNSTGNLLVVPSRRQSLKRTMSEIYWRRMSFKVARKENEDCVRSVEWEDDLEEIGGYSSCWPQDWLPKDCPGARVIALNYTTDVLWCPVWKKKRIRTDMVERSDEMIEELLRLGVGSKPIIWVGHSKGGLFIKQIILNVCEKHRNQPEINNIFQQSRAIMFYSVPHKGSSLADFTLPLLRRSVELVEIQRNCEFVLDMHKRFLKICENGYFKAEIFSFIETSFTLMSFIYLKIVAYDSADPDIGVKCGVPLDHREICKPAGRDCFLYQELVKLIKRHLFNDS